MMVDALVIERKLQKLSEYLDELEAMRGITLAEESFFAHILVRRSMTRPIIRTS